MYGIRGMELFLFVTRMLRFVDNGMLGLTPGLFEAVGVSGSWGKHHSFAVALVHLNGHWPRSVGLGDDDWFARPGIQPLAWLIPPRLNFKVVNPAGVLAGRYQESASRLEIAEGHLVRRRRHGEQLDAPAPAVAQGLRIIAGSTAPGRRVRSHTQQERGFACHAGGQGRLDEVASFDGCMRHVAIMSIVYPWHVWNRHMKLVNHNG